jgi:hypothetical protein
MFDQVMDTFRKMTESTLKAQQQLMRQWAHVPSVVTTPFNVPEVEHLRAYQKQVSTTLTELMKRHRETLDAQYGLDIQALEEAFRVGDTKDPAEFMKRTEELCKHSFDCIKAVAEDQMKGLQAASEKWLEVVTKGAVVTNEGVVTKGAEVGNG